MNFKMTLEKDEAKERSQVGREGNNKTRSGCLVSTYLSLIP